MPPLRPVLPLSVAAFAAAVGGLVLTTAFPALAWWPMAFVGVGLALVSLIGRSVWGSVLVGLLFGLGFFLVNVGFTARYLGPVPWLALSVLEALLTAVGAIPIALAYRWLPRIGGLWTRLVALPALVAGLWTSRELLVGSWPYGGFPWGRIGLTQSNSPLADLASWVGVSGLTFLIVALCAALIEYVRLRRFRDARAAVPAAVLVVLLIAVPQFPTTPAGSMRVGAAQGNGPSGYFDKREDYAVIDAQVAASEPLFGKKMDLLVWPEGGVDYDPTQDRPTAALLDAVQRRSGAPLLANAVVQKGEQYFNTSFVWRAPAGITQSYAKRHPVPFGEYVPDRWLYGALAPDLIGLIQREYTPGEDPPYVTVKGVGIGLAICFDVIYDDVIRDGARAGAEFYAFQTNNADFRGTDENLQQLAVARMRAIETGRSVVNISTVGTSQIIAPDGSTIQSLPADTAGHLLADVPLRTGLTPAIVIGDWLEAALGWGSLAALVVVGLLVRRRNAKTPAPEGTGAAQQP
ncbi:apolipoprotein N-acyltransferase [Microbacterium sp. ASV49]|uniref:Apolipoprotein N-acyltransferase n=1 Tax=Microbacterium candidum TaxID=3041922 RepID=A0ABT7MZH2_9MICO|nr:apolipoprotein N-acyltransferase [Microbacterium sp. ASV49]MDL9979837.1 apolipoprotein N-acyltransferase [Microbacterium sp. ASV49]